MLLSLVMLSAKHETSNTNANKDVSPTAQHDNTKDTDLLKNLYGNNREADIYANMESNPNIKAQQKALNETDSNFTYTTQETKGIKDLRNDLREILSQYKTQPITNKETGMQGIITTDEINKISSRKAIDKSIANGFTRDEHFKVAQDLKTLFENSVLRESHNDYKNNPNILQVHRFAKDININGKEANAQITLFEKIEGNNRIYTLELESLNKPDSLSVSVHNTESAVKAQSVATAHPETTPIAKTDIEIIPQIPKDNSNPLKTFEYFKDDFIKEYPKALEFHEGHIPMANYLSYYIIPQIPKDNSNPLKTFEYFKDDFIKEYPKALEFHEGHIPMANYLSYYAKESIIEKQIDLLNTAAGEFSRILKDIGFKKDEMKPVVDTTNIFDVEYSLSKVRKYLDFAEEKYNNFPKEQQVLAKKLLNHKQDILNIYESKIPQDQELENKRNLMSSFHDNARVIGSDEYNLLKNLVDELYKPQTPQEIIKQAKKSGKSVKETKELLQKKLLQKNKEFRIQKT